MSRFLEASRAGRKQGVVSNASERLPLAEARAIAEDLVALLSPGCERIEIAGSIRRQRDTIGDVELVVIPRYVARSVSVDMFGETQTCEINQFDQLCRQLLDDGTFAKRLNKLGRTAWGTDLKWGTYRGFAIDLYTASLDTWAVLLAIRTGSAEFSHRLVTPRRLGGLCPSNLHFKGWRVCDRRTGEPIPTPEEADVFETLGLAWPEPWLRTDTYQPSPFELRKVAEMNFERLLR